MKIIIATVKSWNIKLAEEFRRNHPEIQVLLVTAPDKLNLAHVKKFDPDYIFFPHWSWIIPEPIWKVYRCVIFHMTDVPYGRGGSPLQNLIVRGKKNTKISALHAAGQLDAGPVYMKEGLSLKGTAQEIFNRAAEIIFKRMIPEIVKKKRDPIPQKGKVVTFKRRRPDESDISGLSSLTKVYDHIRMLDAEGYPVAFIVNKKISVEFTQARIEKDYVLTQAKIRIKK